MTSHLKCAAFEFPSRRAKRWHRRDIDGKFSITSRTRVAQNEGQVALSADTYPAQDISLHRRAGQCRDPIRRKTAGHWRSRSVRRRSGLQTRYTCTRARSTRSTARPRRSEGLRAAVDVDYYTDAQIKVGLKVIDALREEHVGDDVWRTGELSVTWLPSIYKKIKFGTHENVGWGEIHLPESTMHTTGYWIEFPERTAEMLDIKQTELSEALSGLANTLRQVAPVQVLCDPTDIRAQGMLRAPFSELPTIYMYETYPGGVGFSEKLFTHHRQLFEAAMSLISGCTCKEGCPSCTGPSLEVGAHGKRGALDWRDGVDQRRCNQWAK